MNNQIKEQVEMMNQQIKELGAVYHEAASRSGISDNELWVWYTLVIMEGEYSQQDICDMWSLPKQTINSIISNLSKKGYIFLETIPGTRNRKIIRVSETGKIYSEQHVKHIYQAEQNAFEKMSEKERAMCITLLGKYISSLKEELSDK